MIIISKICDDSKGIWENTCKWSWLLQDISKVNNPILKSTGLYE